jgi:hypothetical protein
LSRENNISEERGIRREEKEREKERNNERENKEKKTVITE